jgi:hypothetical protein
MGSIQAMQPWERSRNQQARYLRSEWPQSQGWSFSVWTGFAPIVPMGVGAYVTRDYGVLVTIGSAATGYLLGLLVLWVGSWTIFAVRGPSQATVAARTHIEDLDEQARALAAEVNQVTGERDEAVGRANAAQRGSVTIQHHHHYYEGRGPRFDEGDESEESVP